MQLNSNIVKYYYNNCNKIITVFISEYILKCNLFPVMAKLNFQQPLLQSLVLHVKKQNKQLLSGGVWRAFPKYPKIKNVYTFIINFCFIKQMH